MKNKVIIAVIISTSLLILIVACQQSKDELINHTTDNYPTVLSPTVYDFIMNTGIIHNQGVDYILQHWDTSRVFNGYNYFQDFWSISNVFSYQIQGWDSLFFDENNKNLLLDVFGNETPKVRLQFLVDSLKNTTFWAQTVTFQETQIISGAITFLNSDFSNYTRDGMFNKIINYADSSLLVWEQITWPNDSLGSGSVSGGYLNVMKSSAQYWKNNLDTIFSSNETNTEVPCGVALGLVGLDVAAFYVGYAFAIKKEIDANGKLVVKNQNKRLQAGVDAGLAGSTMGFLKYRFGF